MPQWSPELLRLASTSALIFLVWEHIITFDDEVKYIWTIPRLSVIKFIYLAMRYLALSFELTNHSLTVVLFDHLPLTEETCRTWYTYQITVTILLVLLFEAVLMIRVYALYNRSHLVGRALASIFAVDLAIMVWTCIRTMQEINFDYVCVSSDPPRVVMGFGLSIIVTQVVIWVMTLARNSIGWGRTPVASLLIRDGFLVFVIVSALVFITVLSAFVQNSFTHVMMSWSASICSTATCRMVVNLQRVLIGQTVPQMETETPQGAQFTSIMDVVPERESASVDAARSSTSTSL